jgi:hypothetical protein
MYLCFSEELSSVRPWRQGTFRKSWDQVVGVPGSYPGAWRLRKFPEGDSFFPCELRTVLQAIHILLPIHSTSGLEGTCYLYSQPWDQAVGPGRALSDHPIPHFQFIDGQYYAQRKKRNSLSTSAGHTSLCSSSLSPPCGR